MKIRTIEYRQLVNCGNFENFTFSATAELSDHDNPEWEARHLAEYVHDLCVKRQRVWLEKDVKDWGDW